MKPRLDDMLIHNLTLLFHAVGQIVCLKLMPKTPIQRLKRLFLDDYPIETASPEGTFCDTIQVPSGAGDMQLI